MVSAALVLDIEKQVCRRARIVLGGVAPIPWRLPKVEAMLAASAVRRSSPPQLGKPRAEGARPLAKNKYKVPSRRLL